MKLTLDMLYHLLNASTKIQMDISKHVEKSLEKTDGQMDRHCHMA